mmetsp:Transcript_60956/g.176416  ORF Transcript_60956/g.176416 Transcript_60956/m.176416 type:complete len:256 (-) Transcript_60956:36-803(-)
MKLGVELGVDHGIMVIIGRPIELEPMQPGFIVGLLPGQPPKRVGAVRQVPRKLQPEVVEARRPRLTAAVPDNMPQHKSLVHNRAALRAQDRRLLVGPAASEAHALRAHAPGEVEARTRDLPPEGLGLRPHVRLQCDGLKRPHAEHPQLRPAAIGAAADVGAGDGQKRRDVGERPKTALRVQLQAVLHKAQDQATPGRRRRRRRACRGRGAEAAVDQPAAQRPLRRHGAARRENDRVLQLEAEALLLPGRRVRGHC